MNKKYILLGLLIGMSLILGLTLLTQYSKSTIQNPNNLTWNKNIIYENENNTGIIPDLDYNLRNKDYFNGNYFASFSFDNDIGKENEIIPFISNIPNSASAKVLESFDNHYSVLELNTTIIDENLFCNWNFYDVEGDIEFWIQTNNTDKTKGFALYDDNQRIIHCYLHANGNYQYLDGVTLTDTGYPYYANNWTHIRIHWQADDDFDWYINGREILSNGNNFHNQLRGVNRIMFYNDDDSIYYIDAFGIDNFIYDGIPYYELDDNLISNKISTNDLEIDKFEFDYDNQDFRLNNTPFKYIEIYDNDLFINKINDIESSLRWISLPKGSTYSDYVEIEFNSTNYIYNLTTEIRLTQIKETSDLLKIHIYTYDSSDNIYKMTGIILLNMRAVGFYDYLSGSAYYIYSGKTYNNNDIMDLNCYFNFYDNLLVLDANGTTHQYNLKSGTHGIQKIEFEFTKLDSATYSGIYDIYNFGLYENGTSLVSDINELYSNDYQQFGYSLYQLHDNDYYPITKYNLLDYDILVNDCTVYNSRYYDNYKQYGFYNIFERNNYSEIVHYNLINNNNVSYMYSYLIFEYYNNVSYPFYLKSEGLYLSDISVDFYPYSYFYKNSEKNDNYFYVNNNKLYYRFNNSELDNPEYMRLSFNNINYLIQENDSIGFNSFITGNYSGYIRLGYNDASFIYLYLNQSNTVKYSEYILPEGLILVDLRIVISVDNYDTAIGITEGYIDVINIGNRYNTYTDVIDNLNDSVLDLDFLEGIIYVCIILILLIIPCYLVYERYGKKVVIPMFILIVIVLMVSTFLPIWLSIILLISSFLFLYHTSKRDDLND